MSKKRVHIVTLERVNAQGEVVGTQMAGILNCETPGQAASYALRQVQCRPGETLRLAEVRTDG